MELTADAFEGLPADAGDHGSPESMAILTFPEQASATPFKWLMLNWNPQGHIPPGVYDVPHHDFHFYIMEQSKLDEIKAGTCEAGGEGVDCETFERGMAPVPAEYVAPDYITVGAVVPAMGNHLIDPTSPEFSPTEFTHTFIYGTFDGEITFYEPMITRKFLLGQPEDACAPIKMPESFDQANWYPTEYCMRYHQEDNNYTVSLEKFVAR